MKTVGALVAGLLLLLSQAIGTRPAVASPSADRACTHCGCGGTGCCVTPVQPAPLPSPAAPPPASSTPLVLPHDLLPGAAVLYLLPPAWALLESSGPGHRTPLLLTADVPLFARHCAFLI